jgi:hypothetical protein
VVRRLLLLVASSLLALAAWVFLVMSAIDLGRAAREAGNVAGWVFTVVVTLGAALCLLLVLVLIARIRSAWQGRARRQPGRHRQTTV